MTDYLTIVRADIPLKINTLTVLDCFFASLKSPLLQNKFPSVNAGIKKEHQLGEAEGSDLHN